MRPVLLAWVAAAGWVPPASAQIQRAPAPPVEALWLKTGARPSLEVFPLLWYNDRGGPVTAAWVRLAPSEQDSLWLALGTGWREPGRAPSVLEAGLHSGAVQGWFKHVEGRRGLGASYAIDVGPALELSVTGEEAALVDDAFLRQIFFFDCPADAPAAPCDSVRAPLSWGAPRDRAAELRLTGGAPGSPITWSVGVRGAPAFVGDVGYVQGRVEAVGWRRAVRDVEWRIRWAAAWTSRETPLQSRFFAHGSGPLERWTNPYLRSRGAPLERLSYFAPGGAHLRAYGRTSPLLRRFTAVAAEARRAVELPWELEGSVSVFLEAAWIPGLPESLGRSSVKPDAAILFNWTRLTPGEEEAGGKFNAEAFRVPSTIADAGVSASVELPFGLHLEASFPVWASVASLADRAHDLLDPLGEGEDRAFGLRWALTLALDDPVLPGRGPGPLKGF